MITNMPCHKILLPFFFITLLHCSASTEAQPITYLNHSCSSDEILDATLALTNLKALLNSFTSYAAADIDFYNTSVVAGRDTLSGLFMCRGDVSLEVCHKCVVDAVQRLQFKYYDCDSSKEAVIWYDECLVRYSNRSIFSTVDTGPRFTNFTTGNNVSDQASFRRLLYATMNTTADKAARSGFWEKKYATAAAKVSGTDQTMYCLAQCTTDLSTGDCRRCLSGAIGDLHWCCEGKQGGKVLYPSCSVRYELYPFYNYKLTPAAAFPSSNSSAPQGQQKGQSRTIMIVVILIVVSTVLFCFGYYYFWRRKTSKSYKDILKENFGSESSTLESLHLNLTSIEAATNKFSVENRIGKGGFGEVYKGILPDGREIAVKRLSESSRQGLTEFKNEVLLIAKLQHRNLVALLGFCLKDQEKLLVYEYVPNKSLDFFLFGSQKERALNWSERFNIIGGIARGILYLHEHSRLKVIHRDLKPSNVLLDDKMNPKIADFGLARMVGIDETRGSTDRIVGTLGYMSPEYVKFGLFSEKSDVFSFGVMVLEIVSGRQHASSHHGSQESQYSYGLLSRAWKHWKDEKLNEILDSNMEEADLHNEMIKCIHIGLLCVQENPEARPSMSTVVQYLSNNDSICLPNNPQEPAFFIHDQMNSASIRDMEAQLKTNRNIQYSVNQITETISFPR